LKTSPGPLPLPRIRSGAALTGAANFGAGSLENRAEEPAPRLSMRGFLAGRGPPLSLSAESSFGNAGRSIAIFLGAFLTLGVGRVSLDDPDANEGEGAGSEREDLLCRGDDREGGICSSPLLLSLLSLPYASTSMAVYSAFGKSCHASKFVFKIENN
jgi:hypothetical protein